MSHTHIHTRRRAPLRPAIRILLLACVSALASGCLFLNPAESQDIHRDISKINLDVSGLRSDQSKMLKELKYDLGQLEKSVEAQRQLQRQFSENVDGKLAAIQEDLDTLSFELRKSPSPATDEATSPPSGAKDDETSVITNPGPSTLSTPDQEKRLRAADEDFYLGDYDKAIDQYSLFLQDYSDSPIAPKAAYNLARCYHEQKNYEVALKGFQRILATYPASDIIPQTLFSRAICEYNLQRTEEARATLSAIQAQYPDYEPEQIKDFQKRLSEK